MYEPSNRSAPPLRRPCAFRPAAFGRIFALFWLPLALFTATPQPCLAQASIQEAQATSWRMALREGGHRFVMDLTDKVSYQVFTLADPDRIVVDITPVAWRLTPSETIGPVRSLRTGRLEAGVGRLVLDLAQPARVSASRLLEPRDGQRWRLVLDLEPVARDAFLRSVGPPGRLVSSVASLGGQQTLLTPASSTVVGAGVGQQVSMRPQTVLPPPILPPSAPKPSDRRQPVIVIDAGHGGQDPGAISVSGGFEKAITLETALELRRQLQATGRYKVLTTRSDDRFIPLRDRVGIARSAQADLFISIHADSMGNPNHRGLTVYTVSDTASDREAEALAQKENKADVIAGVNLGGESPQVANILIDLTQRETKNHSVAFASLAVRELSKVSRTVDQAHRFAGFLVLTAADVPSVLIELGYLSNREDERDLQSPVHRKRLAESIATAVDAYFAPQAGVNVASLGRSPARKP